MILLSFFAIRYFFKQTETIRAFAKLIDKSSLTGNTLSKRYGNLLRQDEIAVGKGVFNCV